MANGGLSFRSLRQPGRTSAPAVNEYQGRGGRGGVGRITSAFQGGSVTSSLTGPGGGLASLAQGFKDLGAVFEQQEEERQRLEAIETMSAAQDEERAMFEQMSQMTGSAGYAAPELAGKFYQDLEGRLMKGARGDFQRGMYAKALAGMRDQGLNQAVSHRLREHEVYKGQVYDGQQARLDSQILADPENVGLYTSEKRDNLRRMYPNAAPEWLAAKSDELSNEGLETLIKLDIADGRWDDAERRLQQYKSAMPTSSRGGQRVRGAEFALPTDNHHYITSPFGPRTAPSTPQGKGSSDHKGIDLRMPVGTPVKAISGGTVSFSGPKGGYGTTVIIKHDDGSTTSQYGHLSRLNFPVGTRVKAGDVIALSGNTGKSTGPHLDLKIAKNGQYVDPAPLLGISRGGKLSGPLETTAAKERPIMLASLGGRPIKINDPGIEGEAPPAPEPEFVEGEFTVEPPPAAPEGSKPAVSWGGRANPDRVMALQNAISAGRARDAKALADGAKALVRGGFNTHIAGVLNNGVGLADFDVNLNKAFAGGAVSPEEYADLNARIDIARNIYGVTRSPDGLFLNLDDAAVEIGKRYPRPEPLAPGEAITPEHIRRETNWTAAMTMLEEQRKAYQERPLDYVAAGAQAEYETMQQHGLVPEGREAVTQIEVLRRNAAEKGNLTRAEASLLPATTQAMRDNLAEMWRRAETPEAKKEVFASWQNTYGEYFPQVLADIKVGYGAMLSTLISPANPELGEVLMRAEARKEAEYKLDKDTKDSVLAKVNKKLSDGYMGVVQGLRTNRLNDDNARALFDGMKTSIVHAVYEYAEAGRSVDEAINGIFGALDSRYSAITDPDLGYVALEKGKQDEGAVFRGLNAIKEAMGASWDVNDLGQDWDGPTLFRNHQDGVIVDFPNGAGLYFTFAEVEEIGGPSMTQAMRGVRARTAGLALGRPAIAGMISAGEPEPDGRPAPSLDVSRYSAFGRPIPRQALPPEERSLPGEAELRRISKAQGVIARNRAMQYGPAVPELVRASTVERLRGEPPPLAQRTERPNWKRLEEGKTKGRGR